MSVLHNIAASLPEFTEDPVARLAHTLAAFPNAADDQWVVEATRNAIPGADVTGLTWGDLRALYARLNGDTTRPEGE